MTGTKEPQMGLSFEQVWAMFEKTEKLIEENAKGLAETNRGLAEVKELFAESDRKFAETVKEMKESSAKTGKYLDKVSRNIDNLGKQLGAVDHRFGDVVEHLVIADVINKFNNLGYKFKKLVPKRKFKNEDGSDLAEEADILLGNGEYLMAVEVKAKPDTLDVNDHVQRLLIIRNYLDKHGEKRKLLGAIAGAVMNDNLKIAPRGQAY